MERGDGLYLSTSIWTFFFFSLGRLFFSTTFNTFVPLFFIANWSNAIHFDRLREEKCCNIRLKHEHMTIQMILEREPQNPRPSKLCTAQSWRLFAVARNFISVTQRSTILELNFTDQSISVLSPQTLWTHSRWPTLVFFLFFCFDLKNTHEHHLIAF